jgi:hypothetical protein
MNDVLIIIAFITVILGLLSNLINFEANRRQYNSLHNQGAATHELVNSNNENIVARVDQLTAALQAADVVVPPNGKGGMKDAI